MAIQDNDLFLIDDAGTSKKIKASKLRNGLTTTYANMKLLVNRSDYSSCFVYCKDLQTNLPADHWMMVERSGTSYKVNGTKVLDYFPSGPAGATGQINDAHPVPITNGSTGTHNLTVASLASPNFADNEAIRMVDSDGDTASYIPVTSTITNVDASSPSATKLTFADPCPDLKFFQPEDEVQLKLGTGDIYTYTDKGFFAEDPDPNTAYGTFDQVFATSKNTGFVLLKRPNAWEEFGTLLKLFLAE